MNLYLPRTAVIISTLLCTSASSLLAQGADPAAQPPSGSMIEPTLKLITGEQDWIARSPSGPRWLIDGSAVMYSQRREGLVGRDFSDRYLIFLSAIDAKPAMITPENPGPFFTRVGDWDKSHRRGLVEHNGDLFLFDAAKKTTTQITRTSDREGSAMFMLGENRIGFDRGGNWYIRSLSGPSMIELQAADIRYSEPPKDPSVGREKKIEQRDDLQKQQRELFEIIRLNDERSAQREDDRFAWRDTDPTGVPGPFYLGKNTRSMGTWLSPSGRHMLAATAPNSSNNQKRDIMPNYVTENGYVQTRFVRTKVGYVNETPVALHLLDLKSERVIEIDFSSLPGISEDPLAWLKDEANAESEGDSISRADADKDTESEPKEPRPVSLLGVRWSDSGRYAAAMLRSHDNKDRWLVLIDTQGDEPSVSCADHLHDEAWIGWDFNEFGFIPKSDSLWYVSEASNFARLYSYDPGVGIPVELTFGNYEVRDITFTSDGSSVYMRSNRTHPGIEEIDRLHIPSGALTAITSMKGTVSDYQLSPDESRAVFSYSNLNDPPELYLIDLLSTNAQPERLTHTVTKEFRQTRLQTPEIVAIPSTHTTQPIYTRVYRPDPDKFPGKRPLVVFSHGAGYLQHANYEWSYYSREHMFHTILANEGFVVVAPDFRASAGYGRDWRTAIYRQMGYKELEDFKDAIDWAVSNENADPERVGVYGGSYGGFMTLMAMFLEPDTFKCGAALRSVTDWRHYNHGYTSNILNTPDIDPEAFDISSPINHAEGLEGHLLMLHGLQDDNVVAQDIIRLSQRLIELEKENWELALAPIEPHGYHEPSSWLDQMRRIHKLFSSELNSAP